MRDTEETIRAALKSILTVLSWQSVTIQGVCDKAGISRKTFLRYFSTKEDVVVSQIEQDFFRPIETLFSLLSFPEVEISGTVLLERTYDAFIKNKDYYQRVIDGLGMAWFTQRIASGPELLGKKPYARYGLSCVEESFAIHFFNHLNAAAFTWWIENDYPVSPKELANLVFAWGYGHNRELEASL